MLLGVVLIKLGLNIWSLSFYVTAYQRGSGLSSSSVVQMFITAGGSWPVLTMQDMSWGQWALQGLSYTDSHHFFLLSFTTSDMLEQGQEERCCPSGCMFDQWRKLGNERRKKTWGKGAVELNTNKKLKEVFPIELGEKAATISQKPFLVRSVIFFFSLFSFRMITLFKVQILMKIII